SGKFDTVTLIHNETSTGVMNPLPEICCTLAKYADVALIVDTVSSFSAMKIDMDALGIDVMLTGAQKALALPPGFSLFSVSEKAFRSKTLTCVKNNKGIDVLAFAKRLREEHHLVIDPGYGKLRGKTFRLSNMGDETEKTVSQLLGCVEDVLK